MTAARRAVLDTVEAWDGSFTAIELFDQARRRHPPLGLATTYRTIDLLRRTGGVRPLAGDDRRAYVRCQPGHHHHLVCTGCGSVQDTELCAAPPDEELRRRHGFAAQTHEVDIYGLCSRCAA
jgi:Fur family transcriptional regulator, ferric uptake regulator